MSRQKRLAELPQSRPAKHNSWLGSNAPQALPRKSQCASLGQMDRLVPNQAPSQPRPTPWRPPTRAAPCEAQLVGKLCIPSGCHGSLNAPLRGRRAGPSRAQLLRDSDGHLPFLRQDPSGGWLRDHSSPRGYRLPGQGFDWPSHPLPYARAPGHRGEMAAGECGRHGSPTSGVLSSSISPRVAVIMSGGRSGRGSSGSGLSSTSSSGSPVG